MRSTSHERFTIPVESGIDTDVAVTSVNRNSIFTSVKVDVDFHD